MRNKYILLEMNQRNEIRAQMDIHIGKSKILGKTVFIACPYENMNQEYHEALNQHFDI